MDVNFNDDLDKAKHYAVDDASKNICHGDCEVHGIETSCVRVVDERNAHDWGWFSYCKKAIEVDTDNGFSIIYNTPKPNTDKEIG